MELLKNLNRVSLSIVTSTLVFASSSIVSVSAQPFYSFDSRSMGMGGTTVASSQLANAAYANPAMVSQPIGNDNFQLLLPVAGVNVDDSRGLIDDIEEINRALDALDAPAAGAALDRSLGKPLTVQAYAGGAFGFAVDKFAMVFIYNKQYIADFRTVKNFALVIDSTLEGRGLEITDAGIAIPLYAGDNFKFGVTPKVVGVNSYDYEELIIDVVTGTTVINENTGRKTHGTHLNVDVGAAYDFKNGYVIGLSGRNLATQEFKTIKGNVLKLEPVARIGFAYNSDLYTLAADYDLTKNNAIAYGESSQLITIGAELNFFDWVAIRVGHQENLASKFNQSMNSIGLGFTPFGVGLDIAVMGNEHAGGASAQLSFTF